MANDLPVSIFAGRSVPALARGIADAGGWNLGDVTLRDFSDGEIYVRYEESIRGTDLFIVQSTPPPAEHWMELFLMIDAARRASAARITAVIPYFGYARQDRKDQPRVSIAARMIAKMLQDAGVDRVLTMDLHAAQIQGFFDIPVDHLYGSAVFEQWLDDNTLAGSVGGDGLPDVAAFRNNLVVVAPDVGASKIARAYAKRLGAGLALIDKRRPEANVAEVMNIIGDVDGRNCLLIDDLCDTAGTLSSGAQALHDAGALDVQAFCTHPLLSGPAVDRIEASPLSRVIVTDSVPLQRASDKIEVISVAPLFAESITRIGSDESISTLFVD
ncbi:ribose-phosphate diphosphokinase [Rubrivirga sp.]|uniref:ribose-phosphate diphosphokinase n=1 Tax=Rubrivirga sp. TaxID=1885344 RepID=UPI003C7063BA